MMDAALARAVAIFTELGWVGAPLSATWPRPGVSTVRASPVVIIHPCRMPPLLGLAPVGLSAPAVHRWRRPDRAARTPPR